MDQGDTGQAGTIEANLALVLGFDASASVTFDEFGLMTRGVAAALRDPAIIEGLTAGPYRASYCAVLVWSAAGEQEVMVEWTRIASQAQAREFADAVENMPRMVRGATTAIGPALIACLALLANPPAPASRSVIDLVGDGRANDGIEPSIVRDQAVSAGVTINGLCVLHEEADLLDYYTENVIGGSGAFALACTDFDSFADAMMQKLRREIA